MAFWSALAMGGMLPSVGCQVEYAGMTLPSGRYMHDDVQYFPTGPDFPWANTQAATQRARMRAMGIEPPPPPGAIPQAMGAESGAQLGAGRPTDVNVTPAPPVPGLPGGPVPMGPGPAAVPAPGPAVVPVQPAPGGVPAPGGGAGLGGATNPPPPVNPPGP
ncbi:MAG TPA: hypothetical protein VFF52_12680 [Isosphaeraceae bacterium]|nr:hypothetical protein [Isosphaeraceae bacterium]